MPSQVELQTISPRKLASVRRELPPGAVASAWKPALDLVWSFLRSQPGLWQTGHNVFLYHRPARPEGLILCDFGVEVVRPFAPAGEVYATETPGGQAAVSVHRGPYARLAETHQAITTWLALSQRVFSGQCWEIYGDPTPNPADTETTVVYLLK